MDNFDYKKYLAEGFLGHPSEREANRDFEKQFPKSKGSAGEPGVTASSRSQDFGHPDDIISVVDDMTLTMGEDAFISAIFKALSLEDAKRILRGITNDNPIENELGPVTYDWLNEGKLLKEDLKGLMAQGEKIAAFANKQSGYEGGVSSPVRGVLAAMAAAGAPDFDGDDEMVSYYTRKLTKAIETQKGKKYMSGFSIDENEGKLSEDIFGKYATRKAPKDTADDNNPDYDLYMGNDDPEYRKFYMALKRLIEKSNKNLDKNFEILGWIENLLNHIKPEK